ncbi:tRNA (adenosine(37)-N6)-threonylcarbamoyltransferase complex ATPase subunit type 1 TsaE [Schaedlerella arabinosiphila]|jgi:tRNA threonylcarbamoyladenosine biosynthesis protein TsaE|uniref:tRNA threonylcarbamoyladenosine biosynthesis protein TsaE n=1 Tax=Schaedlerella arabinosiphila TaxID=2044587 RepID=A0A9X5C9A9_9FIRM|nr:tRNA (adenosine(37)-N6)-threonylcarbamoyltransferase complex ATPase subunit type 1 TsaE [Schaedlerella arabinosiphila]KAI4440230.1 tRNA threonylcarbamoyladenosine biosynthesis protein TsaE [Schaedlerella arabinosiphila]MCI9213599.1 tRNA (adenosine(37)-N6)-threonylcarbamoyltransferase complex ATPase subunit type 1 TsaE [Ruminococcus sp.]MCI9632344.1 tRNA (adenosine(37)-N6)-threonylcarbamoyltransferase complex ATPase subunit type 1 TsaE [Ruminococcus sp.]NDO70048.1 tRNA (adenosine(37)-N6)-thre
MVLESKSPEDTFQIGMRLGQLAKAGEVYTLTGDLGVGKTVFTQGFAKGLGIEEPVNSPTFTILQIYEGGRLPLYHFDVYRIGSVEEMDETGFEEYMTGEGVSLIEWADLIREILPGERTRIRIEKDLEKGFDYRRITVEAAEECLD